MIKYKLTDQKMQTYQGFQWNLGEWQEARGSSEKGLCSDGWLHCYDSPLLAVLHNPIHADISNPRLFEVEVDGDCKNDNGIKCGYKRMRLVREISIPIITTEQKIKYAIFCAKQVCFEKEWNIWADNWLSNVDRTSDAAHVAAHAAHVAAHAAADAAYAAYVAYVAADAYVAYVAADARKKINLIELAEESMK